MTRSQLVELLHNPGLLNDKTLPPLKEVLDAYPFFQGGRLLWMKNLHQLDHIRFNSELKVAAAYVPDREKLFFLINDLVSPLGGDDSAVLDGEQPDANPQEPEGQVSSEAELPPSKEEAVETPAKETIPEDSEFQDFVFPAADLLDYENENYQSVSYSLEDSLSHPKMSPDESHSFSEWLSVLRHNPPARPPVPEEKRVPVPSRRKDHKMDLIDSFLSHGDQHQRIVPKESSSPLVQKRPLQSVQENDDLMTETLANIFIRQKHYRKAIDIFERLRLKYPEKSVYFVRRIKELEELINNQ